MLILSISLPTPVEFPDSMSRVIADLERQFLQLHHESRELIHAIPPELLYYRLSNGLNSPPAPSCGEQILRSAAVVEQTFGGLTANLWDDPFEWTLPETLATRASIVGYLSEVETTRERAFSSFRKDADLSRLIALPSGQICSLSELLEQSLTKACEFYARALSTAKITCRS